MSEGVGVLAARQFTIGTGTAALFGVGVIGELPMILTRLPQHRAALITDGGLVAAGISGKVEGILRGAGAETTVFDGVHPNPSTETLNLGAQALRQFAPEVVVALGGGSVLDAAKGIALMTVNEGEARDFDYRTVPAHHGLPIIAIPTTAGTGAETNGYGVIDDPERKRKFYVGHDSVVPRAAILDPELTCGLGARQTAATGMDVLAHAVESLSSVRTNPYAEGISLRVVEMVSQHLPLAVADSHNIEARSQMLLAAHIAGLAFVTTGLGLGHAVAHALSARLDAAHGTALSVMLPHVLAFNLPVRTETYARMGWAVGVRRPTAGDKVRAEAAIDAIRRLSFDIGMPSTLRELGCSEADIAGLAEDALADEAMANTPRMPDRKSLEALLLAAL